MTAFHFEDDLAPACWHEAEAGQFGANADAHFFESAKIGAFEEIHGRGHGVVSATLQDEAALIFRFPQGGQEGLCEKGCTSRRADCEFVIASGDLAGMEDDLGRAHLGAVNCAVADFCGRFDASEMLSGEARFGSATTDFGEPKKLPGDHRKSERGAEDLASAVLS